MFIARPTVAGKEIDNWLKAKFAGVDAILTDYALELSQIKRSGNEPWH